MDRYIKFCGWIYSLKNQKQKKQKNKLFVLATVGFYSQHLCRFTLAEFALLFKPECIRYFSITEEKNNGRENVQLCGSMIFYCRNIKTCLTISISKIQFIYCILLNESGKYKFVLFMLFSIMFQYSLPFYVQNSFLQRQPCQNTH